MIPPLCLFANECYGSGYLLTCMIHRQVIKLLANLNDAADVGTGILLLGQQARLSDASCRNDCFKHSTGLGENLDFETMHDNCSCRLLKFTLEMKLDNRTMMDFERRRDRGAGAWERLLIPGRRELGELRVLRIQA